MASGLSPSGLTRIPPHLHRRGFLWYEVKEESGKPNFPSIVSLTNPGKLPDPSFGALGNAVAVGVLLRLCILTEERSFDEQAEQTLRILNHVTEPTWTELLL